ncbi:unnamed protein product [Chondrus crispus]|uniref:Uncharacterized protein n=1 Tax=Chondrus crispus TaxID=2769 RepID=R7QR27_CHOCR|nr:unnamed protein product [Chondrus crispus]CDF40574.1 unnamed protein product [Chondrus crispus]|eukprot:XP_005710868.1 unnamed protein product [Chondrus crispus]
MACPQPFYLLLRAASPCFWISSRHHITHHLTKQPPCLCPISGFVCCRLTPFQSQQDLNSEPDRADKVAHLPFPVVTDPHVSPGMVNKLRNSTRKLDKMSLRCRQITLRRGHPTVQVVIINDYLFILPQFAGVIPDHVARDFC